MAQAEPATLDRVVELLRQLRDVAGPPPLLLSAEQSWTYLGLSRSTFYRSVSAGTLPQPVGVEGSGPRWRRQDLDRFVERLKPSRRKARAAATG
jgi:excisionase family DNA binding protein